MPQRTDATPLLAAERQQPMTSLEHATARGLLAEHARDVPASCDGCVHMWNPNTRRYERIASDPGCPWHVRPITPAA